MSDEARLHLSKLVKKYRAEKGLTQKEMAKLCYVSEGTIVFIEKCTKIPRMKTLIRIANVLLIDIGELF